MITLTVKLFPVLAVVCSVFACLFPSVLTPLGFLIVPLLGFIMLGMGATLSVKDFAESIRKPKAVIVGFVLQFGIMPLAAYVIALLLHLPKDQMIGLVMVGSVAGGTASNVIAYLAGGDVALSITMTACSTVGGIFLTPLLSALYLGQTVDVPVWEMFKSILLIVALPVAVGLLINRLMRGKEVILNKVCPFVSVLGIVFVIAIIMALNANAVKRSGWLILVAVILHNGIGMALGYFLSKLLHCSHKEAVTIAIETGMQNSGLAAALSKQFFGISSALPGAIFSVWHNISGSIFAASVRSIMKKFEEKKDDR
ncbi:MAG: bile acid:sodium symporter family protein [Lentisphaeria bacterium]|nr:bile acid:sodium symporter family protein [Lentisphaeria bacterium]